MPGPATPFGVHPAPSGALPRPDDDIAQPPATELLRRLLTPADAGLPGPPAPAGGSSSGPAAEPSPDEPVGPTGWSQHEPAVDPPDDIASTVSSDRPPAGAPPRAGAGRLAAAVRDRLPAVLHGAVLDPAVRGALALAAVALIAAAIALALAWRGAPKPVALSGGGGAAPAVSPAVAPAGGVAVPGPMSAGPGSGGLPASAGAAPAAPSPAAVLVVDVAGKVRRPGVVSLPPGARVTDAISGAGGVLPGTDTSALSLARRLVDGEQILVTGRPGSAAPPGSGAASTTGTSTTGTSASGDPGTGASPTGPAVADVPPGTQLDLNAASVDQLDALPGVGPVLARRIVEWRTQHGRFTSTDELRQVKGLGGKTGQELLALVRV